MNKITFISVRQSAVSILEDIKDIVGTDSYQSLINFWVYENNSCNGLNKDSRNDIIKRYISHISDSTLAEKVEMESILLNL